MKYLKIGLAIIKLILKVTISIGLWMAGFVVIVVALQSSIPSSEFIQWSVFTGMLLITSILVQRRFPKRFLLVKEKSNNVSDIMVWFSVNLSFAIGLSFFLLSLVHKNLAVVWQKYLVSLNETFFVGLSQSFMGFLIAMLILTVLAMPVVAGMIYVERHYPKEEQSKKKKFVLIAYLILLATMVMLFWEPLNNDFEGPAATLEIWGGKFMIFLLGSLPLGWAYELFIGSTLVGIKKRNLQVLT